MIVSRHYNDNVTILYFYFDDTIKMINDIELFSLVYLYQFHLIVPTFFLVDEVFYSIMPL